LKIITFTDVFQSLSGADGPFSDDYQRRSAVVFMSEDQLKHMMVCDGQHIKVTNGSRSVVIVAKKADVPNEVGFMPESLYYNALFNYKNDNGGKLRWLQVDGECMATDEPVTSLIDIFKEMCEGRPWVDEIK
jgi:formylmethanofuran dehydrogenase subunit D